MGRLHTARAQFIGALGISTLVGVGLFSFAALRNHSLDYDYLVWNLVLAWVPLVVAVRLTTVLGKKLWSSWEAMGLSLLWLVFLPNSFYMITDFIHLQEVRRVDLLYDVLMFTSFIYTGVVLGFSSLYLIHLQAKKRFSAVSSGMFIGLVLLTCSAGIYIGRDLRWNSWDILTNPGGLLFDVSDRISHLSSYPQMLLTISTFTILLASMYGLLWRGIHLVRRINPQ